MKVTSLETTIVSVPYRHREVSSRVQRDGVTDVIPLSVGVGGWRLPTRTGPFGTTPGGGVMSINLLGLPPGQVGRAVRVGPGGVFPDAASADAGGAAIARLDAFLFDRRSKPEFGDADQLLAASRAAGESTGRSRSTISCTRSGTSSPRALRKCTTLSVRKPSTAS